MRRFWLLWIALLLCVQARATAKAVDASTQTVDARIDAEVQEVRKEGDQAFLEGRFKDAKNSYRYLEVMGSGVDRPDENLAILDRDLGDNDQALAHWLRASLSSNADGFVFNQKGWSYLSAGDFRDAKEAFSQALKYSLNSAQQAESYLGMGIEENLDGHPKLAIKPLSLCLTKSPYILSVAYNKTGETELRLGNPEAALAALNQSVGLDLFNFEAMVDLARLQFKIGEDKDAWILYHHLIALDPGNAVFIKILNSIQKYLVEPPSQILPERRISRPFLSGDISTEEDVSSPTIRVALFCGEKGRPHTMTRVYFMTNRSFKLVSNNNEVIRDNVAPYNQWQISFESENGLVEVRDTEDNIEYATKEPFKIIPSSGSLGSVLLKSAHFSSTVGFDSGDRELRGAIEVFPNPNGFKLVNETGVEDYLYGVVGRVMSGQSPMAAHQAEAVVARTTALWYKSLGRPNLEKTDICDSSACQSYRGVTSEMSRSTKGVQDTLGEVLSYDGRVAKAAWHQDCGGFTEDGADYPDPALKNLVSVADAPTEIPPSASLTPSPKRDVDARPSALTAPSSLTPSPKRDGDARPSALTAPLDAEQILAELRARPPSAVFFDYDKTLTEVNEKGISFPPARNLVEGIKTLLKRGWPVAIITSRTFDRQPASANFANTIEPLISQIPESLRDHLFFVGGAGSEFIAFNKKGKPVRYLDRDWSDDEKAKIASIIDDTLSELKVSPDEVNISRDLPSQMLARFNAHGDPRSTPFAELLDKKLKERGLLFPVIHGGDFVYFNKFDKGMGAALIYSAMRQKGFSVSEDNLLFVGDEFHMFPNGTMGGDAKMALAFPKSLAITVGKDMRGALPPSVLWLGGRTSGTDLVMRELLKMPAPRLNGVLSKKTKYLAGASFAVGGLGGILLSQPAWVHFLHHPMAVLGMAGTSLLSAVAIPQIVKNFKLKALATKNLSLMTNLGWAAVSALFLALSLIKHSSPFWVSSNLAGLLENSVLVSQILMYNQKGMRGALGVLPVAAVTAAAIFGGISFPTVLFGAAIGLLTVSSIPQIVANFKLYRAEGKSPEGLSPLLPALALAGSILSLAVAVSQGNIYWILTNSVAIVMSALILAQIYAPGRANSILAKALFPRR